MTTPSPAPSPSPEVLRAFGLDGPVVRLPGGRGLAVLVGGAVLVPQPDEVAGAWAADLAERTRSDAVRLPRPLRSADGRAVVDGWTAAEHVDGVDSPAGRWGEVLAAGRALHRAWRDEPVPGWVGRRRGPWADADRAAWDDTAATAGPTTSVLVDELVSARRPLPAVLRDQLVHGDLTGNVLLPRRPREVPTVIDVSPYQRPAEAALATVVVDGLLWHGAPDDLVTRADLGPAGPQLLLRAALFRLLVADTLAGGGPVDDLPDHERVARRVLGLVRR